MLQAMRLYSIAGLRVQTAAV